MTLVRQSGRADAQMPVALTFNSTFAAFEARVRGPSLSGLLLQRVGGGQPPSGTLTNSVEFGASLQLHSVVAGSCGNTYQWRKGTGILTNETNATLTLPRMTQTESGSYSVIVNNELGLSYSPEMTLLVDVPAVRFLVPTIEANELRSTIVGLRTGLVFVVESSSNLVHWQPFLTNTAVTTNFSMQTPVSSGGQRFFRAGIP